MADTFSATYNFTLPEIGASEDTWGTKLNANWSALDALLDGTTAIAPNLVGWQVGGVAVTSTAAELNILDGVTATAAELNALDGITATVAELNILDGVTATAAELNALDGITATVTELNYTDGVTSNIQTQIDAKSPIASPTFTGVPAAPTAAPGTNTTQVATTAFVASAVTGASSLAATGYTTLPSGLIMQWGVTASIASEGVDTFTLPIAFPTAHFGGQATINRGTSAGGTTGAHYEAVSLTQGRVVNDNTGITQANEIFWFCYGY